jgi:hypothetical protein
MTQHRHNLESYKHRHNLESYKSWIHQNEVETSLKP